MLAYINNKVEIVTLITQQGDIAKVKDSKGNYHYISIKENHSLNHSSNSRGSLNPFR